MNPRELPLTLSEQFFGCTKSWDFIDGEGEAHTLTVTLPAGIPLGSKCRFSKQHCGVEDGVVYVVVSAEDEFGRTREGDNLIIPRHVSLRDALLGVQIDVEALNGKILHVSADSIIYTGLRFPVVGEGFPHRKGGYGDVIIEFTVDFPVELTDD